MHNIMKYIISAVLIISINSTSIPIYAQEVITYNSLESRIESNNAAIKEITIALEEQVEDYEGMVEHFEDEQAVASWEKDNAEEDGNMLDYIDFATSEAVYEVAIDMFEDVVEKLNSHTTLRTKEYLVMQLTSAAQMLMISCETLEENLSYLNTMETMYQEMYEIAMIAAQAGTATALDVSSAYNNMLMISNNRKSLEDSYHELKANLLILLGYSSDADVVLESIPDVDLERIKERDLEPDIIKAIGNNSSLITMRQNNKGGDTPYETELYLQNLEDSEMKIDSKMRALYHEVDQAYLAYETAKVGFESGSIAWETAQAKNQLGMLSESQFLQAEIQYLSREAELKGAELSLIQAMNTYFWARDGILTI